MRRAAALAVLLAALAAGSSRAESHASCLAARVNYTPYGGGDHSWRKQGAQIFVGGKAPQGSTTKILWAFLGEPAKSGADT